METHVDTEVPSTPSGNLSLLLRNVGWLAFQKCFVIVLGIVSTGWVARQLGPERNGVLASAQALVAFFGVFAMGVDGSVLTKRLIERHEHEAGIMGGTTAVLACLGLLSWGGLMAYVWLGTGGSTIIKLTASVIGLRMLLMFPSAVSYWFLSRQQVQDVVIPNTTGSLALRLWQIACAAAGAGVVLVAAAETVSLLVIRVLSLVLYWKNGQRLRAWRMEWREGFEVLRDSFPALVAASLMSFLSRLDVLMLRAFRGEEAAGYFSAAVTLTESLLFINTMVATPLIPLLVQARKLDLRRYEDGRQAYARLSGLLGWGSALTLSLCSGFAVRVVFGAGFTPSAGILSVHALLLVPCCLGGATQAFLTVEGLLRWLVAFLAIAMAVNATLNILLIPLLGGQGAAVASIGGSLMAYVLAPLLIRRTRHLGREMLEALCFPLPNFRQFGSFKK